MFKEYELKPMFENVKSYYGKASVKAYETEKYYIQDLYSYNTLVMRIREFKSNDYMEYALNSLVEKDLLLSSTTTRHMLELLKQQNDFIFNKIHNKRDLLTQAHWDNLTIDYMINKGVK